MAQTSNKKATLDPSSKVLILDPGMCEMQIGIAGNNEPSVIIPSIYADSNDAILSNNIIPSLAEMARERFFGTRALRFKNVLKIHYFFQENDFSTFGLMLKEILDANYWDPKDYSLIIIESPKLTPQSKQKLQNNIFHYLQFPRITFMPSSLCVLSALGMDTGMVVDIGHFSTTFESVFKGFPNLEATFEMPIGGYHLTQYLINLLFSRLQYESSIPLYWVAEEIKHAALCAVINPKEKINEIRSGNKEFDFPVQLPDGRCLTINKERFECVEPLFEPELVHLRTNNIVDLIERSIRTWDRQQIPELVQKIVICGNGSKIPNLGAKIEYLLKEKFAKTLTIATISMEETKKIFWIGASILYHKKFAQLNWIENPEI